METRDVFVAELGRLLTDAYRNDVDVEGGWCIPTEDPDVPNWDVELWPVRSEDPAE